MKYITIDSLEQHDCTFGRLVLENKDAEILFQCFTLELPWLSNAKNISCIPKGSYTAHSRLSPANGKVLEIDKVENRSYIQIHSGNFTNQIQGCILVGDSIRFLNNDSIPDVTNSKKTLNTLLSFIGEDEDVYLRINRS